MSTVAGIYGLRQLQCMCSGRLDLKAVLALGCCSIELDLIETGVAFLCQKPVHISSKTGFKANILTGVAVLG